MKKSLKINERDKMNRKDRTSKVTKVILNDLKGPRVVHHNFSENRIERKKIAKKEIQFRKNKNQTWDMIWRTLLLVFIIDMSLFGYFKVVEGVGFFEGLQGWSNSIKSFVYSEKKNKNEKKYQETVAKYVPINQTKYKKQEKSPDIPQNKLHNQSRSKPT